MNKLKLTTKLFRIVIISSFILFMSMFYNNKYGYYEYKKHQQIALTQEQILKFEEDIKNGKNVNIEDYISKTKKNYQNKISQLGLKLSNKSTKLVKKGVDKFFGYMSKYMIEN